MRISDNSARRISKQVREREREPKSRVPDNLSRIHSNSVIPIKTTSAFVAANPATPTATTGTVVLMKGKPGALSWGTTNYTAYNLYPSSIATGKLGFAMRRGGLLYIINIQCP